MKFYNRFLAVLLIASILLVGLVSVLQAEDPIEVVTEPDWDPQGDAEGECKLAGYDFGYKVDPPDSGIYNPPGIVGSITVDNLDGTNFDWEASFGIDVVISKGGPGANIYYYDEATSGEGLHSPINPQNGKPFGISHITFCWDYDPLSAGKTANTSFTRSYNWDIYKDVDDSFHEGFVGDSFSSNFTVGVTLDVVDSLWLIEGSITINNTNPIDVAFSVSDMITGVGAVIPSCSALVVPAGGQIICSYSVSPGGQFGTLNTATITSSTNGVDGTIATALVTWAAPTTTVGPSSVTVNDTNGESWQFTDDGEVEYAVTYHCDEDEGENTNTATIAETGDSDSETVEVDCYELIVSKTAATSYTRDYDWTISKNADQTSLILSTGQTYVVNYVVTASATGFTDSGHAVSGTIAVNNPSPLDATINSVSDVLSVGGTIIADCGIGVSFPYVLVSGGTLNCSYSGGSGLSSSSSGNNTATATLQNSPSGTTDFSHTVGFNFAQATVTPTDTCVDVSDSLQGVLGQVCVNPAGSFPQHFNFNYSRNLGGYTTCGDREVDNTASFVTNTQDGEGDDNGSDDHNVNVSVPCNTGCTLTQGYWKTHSRRGPAPYDDAWLVLGASQENTVFYLSGKTWYQVFWTPPAGNAYYNLAHQYMAAKLNILNGATASPAVLAAISSAETFFATALPSTSLKGATRTNVLAWSTTLDNFNNGRLGTPHCSEATS
jgi:hypothetical protein